MLMRPRSEVNVRFCMPLIDRRFVCRLGHPCWAWLRKRSLSTSTAAQGHRRIGVGDHDLHP
jgi:hypothetical protein